LFYKALNDWQIQTFKFDNKIGDELEVASKEYLLATYVIFALLFLKTRRKASHQSLMQAN